MAAQTTRTRQFISNPSNRCSIYKFWSSMTYNIPFKFFHFFSFFMRKMHLSIEFLYSNMHIHGCINTTHFQYASQQFFDFPSLLHSHTHSVPWKFEAKFFLFDSKYRCKTWQLCLIAITLLSCNNGSHLMAKLLSQYVT